MIDAADTLRDFLLTRSTITTLVGTRIWAEMDEPPKGHKPSDGPAIVFKARPGQPLDYSSAILHTSWQFEFYAATVGGAHALCRVTTDVLFDASLFGATFQSAAEVGAQRIPDPLPGWVVVLAFFETWMRSALPLYSPT